MTGSWQPDAPDARDGARAVDEVTRLRAELDAEREDADRTLFRATRLARVITVLGGPQRGEQRIHPAAEIAELFSADIGILLVGADDDALTVAERWGVTTEVLPDGELAVPAIAAELDAADSVVAGPADEVASLPGLAPLELRHVAWIRLASEERHLGFLLLGRCEDLPFEAADGHELRAIGRRVALLVDNERLQHETRERVEQLERLLRLGAQLAGTVHLEVAAAVIVDALIEAAPGVTVAVYRRDGGAWRLVAHDGSRQPPTDTLPEPDDAAGVSILPLRDGSRVVACIVTWDLPETEEHRQLLEHLGDVSGLAFSKILLHERTAHQARHDALTGLGNRTLLRDRVARALERHGHQVALLFCDLDRFKVVNDTLGHDAGDRLLVEVARRLSEVVRPDDTIVRLGGDEFVVLCVGVSTREQASAIARRIAAAVAPPLDLDGRTVRVSTSQGVVLARPGDTADTLLRDADAAMYRAKARGRDRFELFDQQVRVELDARLTAEGSLREALRDGRLRLQYQPLVALDSGRLRAVEALLRYEDLDGALVLAGDFIEVAEESDLIVELGDWVLDEAARQMSRWRRDLGATAPPRVLINVSARQLSAHLDRTVADTLQLHDLPATALALEVTERGLLDHGGEVLRCLAALRREGVEVGIDDFGTGYSSLTYLKRFPVDFVKIDREFVGGMVEEGEDANIVDAIIRLTEALGLQAVAEGVETEAQRQLLLRLGCELAQGYYFGPPVSARMLTEDLQAGRLEIALPPVRPAPAAAARDRRTRPKTGLAVEPAPLAGDATSIGH